jgi:hypothetical protein
LCTGCGAGSHSPAPTRTLRTSPPPPPPASATAPARTQAAGPTCPRTWRAAWERLAAKARIPVLCPTWLPTPLTGELGARANTEREASKGSWQVGFVDVDPGFSGLVHVVLEGYDRTSWPPVCEDTVRRNGKVVPVKRPCFGGRRGAERVAGRRVTWYVRNRAIETGHVAAVFPAGTNTFVVGVHVYPPLTRRSAQAQIRRIVRGLAAVEP